MTPEELRAWVVASRRAWNLPDRIEDPAALAKLARWVVQQRPAAAERTIPLSTSSRLAMADEHPEPRNDGAPGAAIPVPRASSERVDARDEAYATTATP